MDEPTPTQVAEWSTLTRRLVANGLEPEQAGRQAAWEVFGELDRVLLFSEADTIEALLARAVLKD